MFTSIPHHGSVQFHLRVNRLLKQAFLIGISKSIIHNLNSISMKYFNSCKTVEDVKHLYKQLAKEHHPDKGGRTATMQEINSEYSFVIAKLLKGMNISEEEMESSILNSERYQNAINSIIGFDRIIIELVGCWIWLTGETYPIRSYLKENGFYYSKPKRAWYFRAEEHKAKYSSKMELSVLKDIYGCTRISKNKKEQSILN